ncbi:MULTISPECIES: murein hydrolase activator EnvC [unclassified Flavobacterium]|uniref:murein hydrolase activator EnvC family protein n=1 Tax=unclassified Flavobacterium TaxID=196869 RepID=UPI001F12C0FD|nr:MULTISPECIES: peptidoglycan DD-metalloendopeptidase family protein [unclassified Flavobacterium]UMY66427.1 peptidoglycan DD-metalloendopeptidase family protein [Flavobacterium sp. HJ-32-4]
MTKHLFTFVALLLVAMASAQGDEQEKLERRKAQLQAEIREQEALLQQQNQKQKSVTSLIAQQTEKIKLREQLIRTTEKQARLLKDNMYLNQLEINRMHRELDTLRADYAEMIRKSYKTRSEQSRAMFLLSSQNFLQAYKRAQYLKQYAAYRKMQGEEIRQKAERLRALNATLDTQKKEKQDLLAEQETERQTLQKEKQEQEKLMNSIKKDKKRIAAEIKKKRSESAAIDRKIDKLIRDAITAANKKAAEANRKANPTVSAAKTEATIKSNKIVLTPEAKLAADNFRANKGKLPWPVERGTVYMPYGNSVIHPEYQLPVKNSGVEIETDKGATARAVFSGTVYKVTDISPVNKLVIIQHGDYFTVYQNLSSVSVSQGEKVSTKQAVGRIRTNGDTGKTILKFMISQNTTYANPATWLYNM